MWLIGQRNIFRPRCFERAHDRTNRSLRLSANQEAELWQRCTAGEALSDIARTLGKHAASVVAVVAEVWHFQPQIVMLHQLRQGVRTAALARCRSCFAALPSVGFPPFASLLTTQSDTLSDRYSMQLRDGV